MGKDSSKPQTEEKQVNSNLIEEKQNSDDNASSGVVIFTNTLLKFIRESRFLEVFEALGALGVTVIIILTIEFRGDKLSRNQYIVGIILALLFISVSFIIKLISIKNYKNEIKQFEETRIKSDSIVSNLAKDVSELETMLRNFVNEKIELDNKVFELKTKQLDQLEKDAVNILENIKKIYPKAREIKDDGENLRLAEEFKRRKEELSFTANWQYGFFCLICLILTGLGIWYYYENTNSDSTVNHLYRIVIVSPLFYLAFFLQTEYRRNRKLIETFAFKEIIATSMSIYEKRYKIYDAENSDPDPLGINTHPLAYKFFHETVNKIYFEPAELIKGNEVSDVEKTLNIVKETLKEHSELLKKILPK